jgi:hypothetical protein
MPSNPSPAPLAKPIALTEEQALALFAAGYPLPADRRSDFLAAYAKEIVALPELGHGVLHRTIARVQREFFDPPLSAEAGTPHHGRKFTRRRVVEV